MAKTLVTFFSASGVTERMAKQIAEAAGADIARIDPAQPYTAADLAGKKVVTWATSGGSGMGKSTSELSCLDESATWVNGEVLHGAADARRWVASLGL